MRPRIPIVATLLMICTAGAAFAKATAKIIVVLPSQAGYTYWLQVTNSDIPASPHAIHGKASVIIPDIPNATLYLVDAQTGQIATHLLTGDAKEQDAPLVISQADFHPVAAQTAVTTAAVTTAAAAPPTPPAPPLAVTVTQHITGLRLSFLLSIVVAGLVGWTLFLIVRSRGQPLIDLARRAGVDVPDPNDLDVPIAESVYEPPKPRPVEKIPDEAGIPPPVTGDQPTTDVTRYKSAGRTGRPQLIGLTGLAADKNFPLTARVITVGRGSGNGIVIDDNTVSRCHARFEKNEEGNIAFTDEDSSNGVYVNGMRVEHAILKPGDEIKIGANYFRFES